jgi:3-methylcrotonyl-CoA carboxylase alpha subunit
MHGKVLAVLVESGAQVAKGQPVAIIEAMKMEHTLAAPVAGRVSEVGVEAGAQVAEGAAIIVIGTEQTDD